MTCLGFMSAGNGEKRNILSQVTTGTAINTLDPDFYTDSKGYIAEELKSSTPVDLTWNLWLVVFLSKDGTNILPACLCTWLAHLLVLFIG